MTTNDIAKYRLHNQQLANTKFQTSKDLVGYFGAMQAQDYSAVKWAIGIRLSITEKTIENAINNGDIIRTHILRPTWHFVSAEDIRWMLALTAPHLKPMSESVCRKLELDDKVLKRCKTIIVKSLTGNKQLTRHEIMLELNKKGIVTEDIRSAHIMLNAELNGLICNGSMRGKQFTYALLDEKVPEGKPFTRSEALAELAKRYFTSHGPATLQDFAWWSGLSLTNAKLALALTKENLHTEQIGNQAYWFGKTFSHGSDNFKDIYLLPAFDEFLVSYKDRSASLHPSIAKDTVTGNGIFRPIIVVKGKVEGLWKPTFKKDSVLIETQFFNPTKKLQKQAISKAAKRFGNFVEMKAIIQ